MYISPPSPPLDARVRAREAVNVRVNTPPRPHPAVWPISRCTRRATLQRSRWWINSSALQLYVEQGVPTPSTPYYYCALVLDDVIASCLASNSWETEREREKPSHPQPGSHINILYIVDLQKTLYLLPPPTVNCKLLYLLYLWHAYLSTCACACACVCVDS